LDVLLYLHSQLTTPGVRFFLGDLSDLRDCCYDSERNLRTVLASRRQTLSPTFNDFIVSGVSRFGFHAQDADTLAERTANAERVRVEDARVAAARAQRMANFVAQNDTVRAERRRAHEEWMANLRKEYAEKDAAREKRKADDEAAHQERMANIRKKKADDEAAREKRKADDEAAREKRKADDEAAREKRKSDDEAAHQERMANIRKKKADDEAAREKKKADDEAAHQESMAARLTAHQEWMAVHQERMAALQPELEKTRVLLQEQLAAFVEAHPEWMAADSRAQTQRASGNPTAGTPTSKQKKRPRAAIDKQRANCGVFKSSAVPPVKRRNVKPRVTACVFQSSTLPKKKPRL
jgi:hypothetical protein